MLYRTLGKTGKQASIIGLGCEHMEGMAYPEVEAIVKAALDSEINIFDVFMPGQVVRENIAKALGSDRSKVMIQGHIGSAEKDGQSDISRDMPTVQKYFEDLLRTFGGYIDLGMMFFIDSEKDYAGVFETGFIDYVLRLKEKGDIGHIGFSSHNPVTATRVIETGVPELMLFSINPAFDMCPVDTYTLDTFGEQGFDTAAFRGLDPTRAALYTLCEQHDVGITVMKTYGAGKLLSAEHTPFARAMTPAQCIHYALTRPAVVSTMVGCKTPEDVKAAVAYLDASEAERDYSDILGTMRNDFRGNCTYCNHCLPCPSNIDIAAVNKYLDIARLDRANVPPSIRSHYTGLSHGGAECIACGSCEERCPFGVPVIENMKDAADIFGA